MAPARLVSAPLLAAAALVPDLTPAEQGPGARDDLPASNAPRPRLQQAAVQGLLAPGMIACRTDEWLALKLRVVGGAGRVESINGFAPGAPDPGGVGQCVAAAVAATRFPIAASATFTVRFEPDR